MISIAQVIILLLVGILLFGNIKKIIEQVVDSINYIKTKLRDKEPDSNPTTNSNPKELPSSKKDDTKDSQ